MRGWKDQDVRVIICLEDCKWHWFVLEWLVELQQYLCHWLHNVPLPRIVREMERHWDEDDPEYFGKFEDWYGDDLGCLWHSCVDNPLSQWVWKHKYAGKGAHSPQWELTLDEARKTFAHDPAIYEWVEKEVEQHKQWDAEKLAEVREAYKAGSMTREQALEKLEWWFDSGNLEALLDGLAEKQE